jgi:hypothetical protein
LISTPGKRIIIIDDISWWFRNYRISL